MIGLVLASAASAWAIRLSREYYRVAPYHHDSVASRMYSVRLHERLRSEGLGPALREVLTWRDSLEPAVRLLLLPRSLAWFHGHLVAAVPLMALFLALVMGYVWRTSRSAALGLAAALLLGPFGAMHDPIQGISDYWRESVATWLLGCAAVAWLMSDDLRRTRWAALGGTMLGALVLARTVAAVFGGLLFAPLLLAVLWRGWNRDAGRSRSGLWAFALPVAGAVVLAGALSGRKLYTHYFVTGWAYGSAFGTAKLLLGIAPAQFGLGPLVAAIAVTLAFVAGRARVTRDRLALGWWAVGLPVTVVAMGTLYHSLSALDTPMLVVAAAIVLARVEPRRATAVAVVAGILAVGGTIAQHARTRRSALGHAQARAPERVFYLQLVDTLLAGNPRQRYGLLFEAFDTHFYNYAFYDRGIAPSGTVVYHTVADTYYRNAFPGLSAEEIAQRNVERLEAELGTVAVGHCAPGAIPESALYGPFSREVAVAVTRHLRSSPRWRALRRFDSPYGCLFVYEWGGADLPRRRKWRDVRDATDGP